MALQRRANERQGPLDPWVERVLRRDERDATVPAWDARVTSVYGPTATVRTEHTDLSVELGPFAVVVGDAVRVSQAVPHRIVERRPRRTVLARPDAGNADQPQVIVANVDLVVIVVSVVAPPLHPRLIDRYLVAIRHGGAEAVICVNKVDLPGAEEELARLAPYQGLSVPILLCSTVDRRGLDDLRTAVTGRTVAFVGHSGVGKSSLVNAVAPGVRQAVGSVSEGYGRGTHTTTTSALIDLPDGTTLVDTPGIRSFGLWDTSEADLAAAFPEIVGARCRFRNCRHESEPGCEVRAQIQSGQLGQDRFDLYRRMRDEAEGRV